MDTSLDNIPANIATRQRDAILFHITDNVVPVIINDSVVHMTWEEAETYTKKVSGGKADATVNTADSKLANIDMKKLQSKVIEFIADDTEADSIEVVNKTPNILEITKL